jgi:hypothetical protein
MKIVGMGVMRNSIQIKLYDIFRKDLHLADERAHELVQTIGQAVQGEYEDNLEGVATKEFVNDSCHKLELKIEQVRSDLELKIEQLRSDLTISSNSSPSSDLLSLLSTSCSTNSLTGPKAPVSTH